MLALAASSDAAAPAKIGVQDQQAMVRLIKYLYAGYENGANDRKSFTETVAWDVDTGRMVERIDRCQQGTGDEIIDFDWPSNSQDPMIKNLSVTFAGGTAPDKGTVKVTFSQGEPKPVVIYYDMTLWQSDPLPHRWGVSNIRIQASDGNQDLRKWLKSELAGDCKKYDKD